MPSKKMTTHAQAKAADVLDTDYYRENNADLAAFDDAALIRHYEEYGRAEGRRPNGGRWIHGNIDDLRAKVPADFNAREYLRLNADVAQSVSSDREAYEHYIARGVIEQRRYSDLDPTFYWKLYLDDQPFSLARVMDHFGKRSEDEVYYRSLDDLLADHDMPLGRWLECFSAREFSLLNFDWVGKILNDAKAIEVFLTEGIDRLAPISFACRFDIDFYREIHSHLSGLSDAHGYRHWLKRGMPHDEPGTAEAWLKFNGLSLPAYPEGFAWRDYAMAHLPAGCGLAATRWNALWHLIKHPGVAPSTVGLLETGGPEFLQGIGLVRKSHNQADVAAAFFERAILLPDYPTTIYQHLGDAYYQLGHWAVAARHYDRFHAADTPMLWSVVLGADAHAKAGAFDSALKTLSLGRNQFSGDQPWLNTVETVIGSYFQERSVAARAQYSLLDPERRRIGDAIMDEAMAWCEAAWASLIDLPVALPTTGEGPVIILATKALKQCTHYRIDQKSFMLDKLERDYRIFEFSEIDAFMAALPGASAAIFYRLPALPNIIRAIMAARSQNIRTFYEIDDLIFDAQNYPDTFESFQGQIGEAVYQGLIYGTPLYRYAMSMCEFGITSTSPLAREMAKVVRSGQVFVVRNGLDDRNIGLDALPSVPRRDDGTVRIFYGSATLAHNQDFHDMAGPGLCAVLEEHPGVELFIVGHLALEPMFDRFADRITRIDLLADAASYWMLLATADINLAVVAPGLMSDAKSEIKWLEAAVVGVPSIVSATATYREVIDDGRTGLLAADPQEWTDALRRLVADADLRRTIATAARADALKKYSLDSGAESLRIALAAGSPPQPVSGRTKPRVLIVNVYFPPQSIGGATRVVAGNLDHWLDGAGADQFDFAIATTDFDSGAAYRQRIDSYRGVPIFRISPPMDHDLDWKPEDPRMGEWFTGVLDQFQPDVVHFHCIQRLTVSIIDACVEADIPYVVSVHDGWWLSDYQFLFDETSQPRQPGDELVKGSKPGLSRADTMRRLARLRQALDGAEKILAPSQTFAQLYRDAGFGLTQAVANGLPDIATSARRPSASGRVRLGHIGDMSPHKGFDLVEAALRQGRFTNIELLALSHARGEHDRLQAVWGETAVTIRGRVPQDRIADLYAELDVLLAPSACVESYGLVTREANAAGLWVVASDRGAIGEDVRPGIDGFVIDVSDPIALIEVLQRIDDDPEQFRQPAPRRDDVDHASVQADRYLGFYREAITLRPVKVAEGAD